MDSFNTIDYWLDALVKDSESLNSSIKASNNAAFADHESKEWWEVTVKSWEKRVQIDKDMIRSFCK